MLELDGIFFWLSARASAGSGDIVPDTAERRHSAGHSCQMPTPWGPLKQGQVIPAVAARCRTCNAQPRRWPIMGAAEAGSRGLMHAPPQGMHWRAVGRQPQWPNRVNCVQLTLKRPCGAALRPVTCSSPLCIAGSNGTTSRIFAYDATSSSSSSHRKERKIHPLL